MQDYVDDIYTSFVSLVAEGRGKTYESVDSIAQGRVWTGKDALKIGLVDEIGTDCEQMVLNLQNHDGPSTTSCPNVHEWLNAFEGADEVFAVTISSGLSASYSSAEMAKQHYEQEKPGARVHIFDSLAMRYRQVLGYLKDLAPFPIERLHVIGGGTYNKPLMQMAANSIGMPVITGPVEGTAIGNIMLQAKAAGLVGDLFEMRKIIADSIEIATYQPQDREAWDAAYEKYLAIVEAAS